ncbi:hypothetical protein LDENG_00222760, partial [Lucifuga dentata]
MKRFSKISGMLKYGFILWEMIVSNVTCMKTEYISLKHAKWCDGPLKLYWTNQYDRREIFIDRCHNEG